MDSKTFFKQIKVQLPRMEGVAIKTEDGKLNFYVDGRLEFYVRPTGGVSFEANCVLPRFSTEIAPFCTSLDKKVVIVDRFQPCAASSISIFGVLIDSLDF